MTASAFWPNVLIEGFPGAGKTHSIRTLIEEEIPTFCLFTDPHGPQVFLDPKWRAGLSPAQLSCIHYTHIRPIASSWKSLSKAADQINKFSYEQLSSLKEGIEKNHCQQMGEIISASFKFIDQNGENFGPIDEIGEKLFPYAVVLDNLSGLGRASRFQTVGFKPGLHQGEWGVLMVQFENYILNCVNSIPGLFVAITHLDRETDEVTGKTGIFPHAPGRKLAPNLGQHFSDVLLAKKSGEKWFWSTTETGYEGLKQENFSWGKELSPSFKPLIEKWRKIG